MRFCYRLSTLILGAWLAVLSLVPARAEISRERYLENVRALASDRFKGRGNDLPELRQAAQYMAEKFKACGLEPVNGSYYQKFRATTGTTIGRDNRLSARLNGTRSAYASGADFVPLGISDPGRVSAQVVFAGYGITAPEYHYDDYAHLDVKGKIVLVLRHEPQENNDSSVFAGRQMTPRARIVDKAVNARMHGAAAMLLVNDDHGDRDVLMEPNRISGPEHLGLLAAQVTRSVADAWLAKAGKSLKDLQATIDADLSNQSAALPVELELKTDVNRKTRELLNVAALLPGSEPALSQETVVIGAHYDHLGLGEQHSMAPRQAGAIHYGADDNASGSAGLLELACDLAQRRGQLKRSFLFLAFAGEELGLLGSAYYTRQPLLALDKTVAMLNLDMIGRSKDGKVYIGGVGTAGEFKPIIEEENKDIGLQLEFSNTGFDSSDHTAFNAKSIPVLFFFSGLHGDYHRPSDTWDKINTATATDIVRLAGRVAQRLDEGRERPAYVRVAAPSAPAGGSGGGYGAYFGSVPDFGQVDKGVRFADVREGSPAALAGLRGGDILVEFAGKPVNNLYDFTHLLRSYKPGDEVEVVVLREQQKVNARVKLGQRP